MRAAASSTASGRSSRRRQSSAIASSASKLGALAEEVDRLGLGKRRNRVLDLSLDAQELAARDEQGRGWDRHCEEICELGRRLDHLLEVVEEEQQLALADVLGEAVLRAERLRDRLA